MAISVEDLGVLQVCGMYCADVWTSMLICIRNVTILMHNHVLSKLFSDIWRMMIQTSVSRLRRGQLQQLQLSTQPCAKHCFCEEFRKD
jgi:hypothetical protein